MLSFHINFRINLSSCTYMHAHCHAHTYMHSHTHSHTSVTFAPTLQIYIKSIDICVLFSFPYMFLCLIRFSFIFLKNVYSFQCVDLAHILINLPLSTSRFHNKNFFKLFSSCSLLIFRNIIEL